MLRDLDSVSLFKMVIPDGDSVCLFSNTKKKHASFVMTHDNAKLRGILDSYKTKLHHDYQCCLFSIKEEKKHNRKENLFRSKVYAWLDIDYKDCSEATEEKIYNLEPTPSIIIRTAGGFHVMWIGEEPVIYKREIDDFFKAFRVHVTYQGIISDSQGSPEKFFRIIGNLGSDMRTVIRGISTEEVYKDYDSFKELIPAIKKEQELMSSGMTTVGRNHLMLDDIIEMLNKCPQMKHFAETGGNTREEWMRFMMIFAFAASRDLPNKELIFSKFMECASNYPEYNGAENDRELKDVFKRYESGQYDHIPSCDSLEETVGEKCVESCKQIPYKSMIGKCSYMRFKMPDGFAEIEGKIFRVIKDTSYEVISEVLKPLYSIKDDTEGTHWLKLQGNKRIITIEESMIPKIKETLSLLSSYHIVCSSERDASIYIKQCQKQARLMQGTNKMGVYDGQILQSNDHDVYPIFSESIDPFFKNYTGKHGDAREHFDCIQYLMKKYPLFALAYSVALVQMLPFKLHANLVVRMYGRAGIGKTLLLRYAKSTIGNPNLFPLQRNVTPLMLVKIAGRTSFFALDELIGGGFNFDQTVNAIFAIHSGNRRLSYHETKEGGYYTTMLATGEQRFTMNKSRDTGIHRRVYELYANVSQELRDDMVKSMPILNANYGFARLIKENVYSHIEFIRKHSKSVEEIFPKYDNINHRDMITLFGTVIALAHTFSGITIEELCQTAASSHTFNDERGLVGFEDLTDYCTNAYMVIKSMYNDAIERKRAIITSTDLELELKKHELDYYPEVMEFIKNVYGWEVAHVKDDRKRTTRTGVVIRPYYPPMVRFIEYFIDLSDMNKNSLMRVLDVVNEKVNLMFEKEYQFKLLVNVICDLRKKNGISDLPQESYDSIGTLKEYIQEREKGLKIVRQEGLYSGFTHEDEEEERRWNH